MPTVSVIIPNYDHARFLRQRVDSVFGQSYQDFEVVLLDDCGRVLAPRGRLVISTPDKEVYTGRLGTRNRHHCSEMTEEEFTSAGRQQDRWSPARPVLRHKFENLSRGNMACCIDGLGSRY
jgi:cellulose synthase/poly-beta-1,6-N-acetylglucosamine synthase-like glycosyltransferase